MYKLKSQKSGFAIIEVLLAISLFSVFSVGIFYLSIDTVQRDAKVNNDSNAMYYAIEGLEAVRSIRDQNYLYLTNGDYGLNLEAGAWEFATAPEDINGIYERTITLSDIFRDESGNIASDGIYFDPDTKKITSEILWLNKGALPRTTTLTGYVSNWRGDQWIQSTCAEFEEGTYDVTESVTQSELGADECGLKLAEIELASTEYGTANLGKHANDVVVEGSYAYIASDDKSKGMQIVNISNPLSPSLVSYLNVGGIANYVHKLGSYLYLGMDEDDESGLVIANVSSVNSPTKIKSIDIGNQGNQPETFDNYLLMPSGSSNNSLKVYDISNPNSPSLTDTVDPRDEVQVATVKGNYAYLGMEDDDRGFRVVDISDPNNVTLVSSLDIGEEANAISIIGNIAFVGTEKSSNSLKVINISDPENPTIETSLDVGGEIQDLTISGNYLYAAVDMQNSGLAAINISNPYNPVLSYTLDISGKGVGIDSDTNYVYIATSTSNKGLVIVGTTVTGSNTSGSYISKVFDTGSSDTIYYFIEWDHTEVPGGSVKFQVRTASDSGSIESATWIGPDGTSSTYYETSRTRLNIPTGYGKRFFQFRAYIESDGNNTPVINSVKINYIPW